MPNARAMVITARAWSGAAQSTTGPLGTYATFWPQGKRRYRMLAPPRIGASGLGMVRSSGALGRPAERRLQLRPASRLQDVAIGVGRDEIVPHSVGVVASSEVAAFRAGDPDVLRLGEAGVERIQRLAHVTPVFNRSTVEALRPRRLSVFTRPERTGRLPVSVSSFRSIPTGGSAARLYTQTPLPVNALRAFPGNDRFCFDTHPPACYDPRMW